MDASDRRIGGRYVLESKLGAGRGGQVFAARDLRTGARVAVKLQDAASDAGPNLELAALRSIEHPHLVRVLDSGIEAGQGFVVTELVDGGALNALPRPLSPETLQALASQMLEALAFLHAQGILHGDVKTENILAASLAPPKFKLADFGLAQRSVDAAAGTTRGSPAFMPPEIIRGEPADERSDLYALGVTLYECAFGELPFDDADVRTVLMRHLTEAPRRLQNPQDVEPRLVSLLRRVLAKDPAERPADARAALAVWRGDSGAAPHWVPPRLGILIGRDLELERLEVALAGDTPAIAIEGPSGLGKTRLMREFALRTELRGVRTLWWTPQGLQGASGEENMAGGDLVTDSIANHTPDANANPGAFAESRSHEVLKQIGEDSWLLFVDDVDSAPPWFIDSLAYLLRNVASRDAIGRLVCVAGRERAAGIVRDALEAGGFESPAGLRLEPWPRAALEAAASALLGARRVHPNLLQLLHAATGSLPADVEAACQQLAENDLLRLDTEGALTVAAETTPQNLLATRSARTSAALQRCTPEQRRLLQVLAAMRAPVSAAFLQAFDAGMAWQVTALQRTGLALGSRSSAGTHYAPAHEGLRQAALDSWISWSAGSCTIASRTSSRALRWNPKMTPLSTAPTAATWPLPAPPSSASPVAHKPSPARRCCRRFTNPLCNFGHHPWIPRPGLHSRWSWPTPFSAWAPTTAC